MNADHYLRSFLAHRNALIGLYAELPEDRRDFAAWEGGLSFLGQAQHLSTSSLRILTMVGGPEVQPQADATTLADVKSQLEQSRDHVARAIADLTGADLERVVPAFGSIPLKVAALLDMLIGHEAHHKGQVWQMARMAGLKPPRYVNLNEVQAQ